MSKTRRWFRFSLGALFLLVTLFGCWLAWELKGIHRRQAALKRMEPFTDEIYVADGRTSYLLEHADIPRWRRLMGDGAISWIIFKKDAPQEELDLAHQLFPEALIAQTGQFDPEIDLPTR